jgi:hypothetical protein
VLCGAGFLGFKTGLERNNVLVNMPVPIFDISDLLKSEKVETAQLVQQVVLQISEFVARNQSPKSKFVQGDGFSQHISLMVSIQHPPPHACRHPLTGGGA